MDELDDFIPQLYRCLALYLQVMRQGLLPAVDQACFHIATQINPTRYARLSVLRRSHFHGRVQALVKRCCSLLTVEQVATLAARLSADQQQRLREHQQAMLEGMVHGEEAAESLPPGSIRLDLHPPLSIDASGWLPLMPSSDTDDDVDDDEPCEDGRHDSGQGIGTPDDAGGEFDLAMMSARLLEAFAMAIGGGTSGGDAAEPAQPPSPWQDSRLPHHPMLLLEWLEWFEQAMARRLRNLSHAINVELTQAGLCSSLLPMGVLDAVINGQLESQAGPVNLLKLDVPLSLEVGTGPMQMSAVLLRCADLEMEQPKLRTCRLRLVQKGRELRRMADQYRRLQRRQQISEAERLWLQDQRAFRNPNP